MTDILETSDTRFDIDNNGWKRMNAGRDPGHLVREAISNCFDVEDVTSVVVMLDQQSHTISIEDDSRIGIVDKSFVSTVFMTGKDDSPTKRGRKGRGLKELIAVADWAVVDTIGFKTTFIAGRVTETSTRTVGTKVTLRIDTWNEQEFDKIRSFLKMVIAPSWITLKVDGVPLVGKRIRSTFPFYGATHVVKNDVQVEVYRNTSADIINLSKGETLGWIYEMGIPVQQLQTRFHININQRIPLNDNRDSISSWFLASLYGKVLDHMAPNMSAGALRHEWVSAGIGYVSSTTSKVIATKLIGDLDKAAIASINSRANDIVRQRGFRIINLDILPDGYKYLLSNNIKSADSIAEAVSKSMVDATIDPSNVSNADRVIAVVKYLGNELLYTNVGVEFFSCGEDHTGFVKMAHWRPGLNIIGFNVSCNDLKLDTPLNSVFISCIIHEFAHMYSSEHDNVHTQYIEKLSGDLAMLILRGPTKLVDIANSKAVKNRKKVGIVCVDCSACREIYPQDAYHTTRCVQCATKHKKAKKVENASK